MFLFIDESISNNYLTDVLKEDLEEYCEENFGDIVRIVRTPKHYGIISAKNFGGKHAIGDVIVFLDAHCEVTDGW